MAPVPQESVQQEADVYNRVVISGMSGLYPNAHNIEELSDILYKKVNPITTEHNRWTYNHPEVDPHIGAVPDLNQFDAQFFRVNKRLGDVMDPMSRKILEESYKAIYDAGLSREHISGKKVGVYIGVCFSESEKAWQAYANTSMTIVGCSRTMFANRISYWLDAKGPSHTIDQGCCSSSAAMLEAYKAIKRGVCDAAIVGGCCLCLHPHSAVNYGRIVNLSMNGTTKSYDQNANGFTRSEAITVFLLQKAQDALRIYGEVVHMKSEYIGLKQGSIGSKFGYERDPVTMANFIKKVYDEAGIPPSVVEYVEGFGSADPEADKSELEALAAVFKPDKSNPLLLGSVMSNLGYTEAATGVAAVTKLLLGYHKGELAGNLHFETPRQDVEATRDGRIKVLADHHKFGRFFTAVNGISATGTNAHILLHGNYKPKDPNRYKSSIPRLVTLSARMEKAVVKMLEKLKSSPVDPEQLALFHNIHSKAISGHLGRGYIILDTDGNETVSLSEKVAYYDDVTPPLVFVYSGMGSQWAGMGAQLMKIPIFSAAIERCDRVLKPKGIDIVNIITSPDKNIFNNILHCFLGIAAVQIGLTDILQAIGLVPDFIIGHSVGEQGCAYGDGCFTTEEMMLSAYYRGLVSLETNFIRGTMAAVGIGYQKMKDMCPPEIEVACHNGPDSCTISGPKNEMKQFMEKLVADNIFTKEVPCSNIAYHSRYIAEAGPELLKYLSKVIKSPKERSKRWLSTSVPQDKWDEPAAKICSAEYLTNNLRNSVLFEETARLLPKNAVMVEIAPHGLLQAIMKRSMPDTCSHVALTKRGHPDTIVYLLEAIGQLYLEGYIPKVSAFYPKVEFPVSTGTPFLSNYVHWSHNESWGIYLYKTPNRNKTASCKFVVSIHDDDYSYLQGHVIGEKTVYPYAAALVAVWDTLAMSKGLKKKQISVEFSDIQLYAQPIFHDRRYLRIYVRLHKGSGKFEVLDGDSTVATGYIKENEAPLEEHILEQIPECNEKTIKTNDVYELLEKRDYYYSGKFRGIYDITESYNKAHIQWNNNWTTFISSLLQMYTLNHEYEGVSEPHRIRSLSIDVIKHLADNTILPLSGTSVVKAYFDKQYEFVCCGGVMIKKVIFRNLPPLTKKVTLKYLKFVPHFQTSDRDITEILQVYLQIISENINKVTLNIVDMVKNEDCRLSVTIKKILNDGYNKKIKEKSGKDDLSDVDIVFVKNIATNNKLIKILHDTLQRNAFIINIEENNKNSGKPSNLYCIVAASSYKKSKLEILKWRPLVPKNEIKTFVIRSESEIPSLSSSRASLPTGQSLAILAFAHIPGLKELVTTWRQDTDHNQIFLINMNQALCQLPELDLAFKTFNNGTWGGNYYLPYTEKLSTNSVVSLQSITSGRMDSLRWVDQPTLKGSGIPVTIHYCSFNQRDATQAMGVSKYNEDNVVSYAMEFSGVTDNGERVMGLIPSGAASSRVLAIPELLWPVPEHWTLEDAATVPLAYAQVIYCLFIKRLKGSVGSVFVHCGAGGLGQAVISIALSQNYTVFTTVSDLNKKRFLLKLFPKLNDENVGNSRDHTFADMVLMRTRGKGCDVVFNCVEGALKNTTIGITAINGTTYDFSHSEDYVFEMFYLCNERSFIPIGAFSLFSNNDEMKKIQKYLADGISQGIVVPLTRITFPSNEVDRALRLLAAGKNRGRVMIKMGDFMKNPGLPKCSRILFSSEQCHLVITDQLDYGLQWVKRLVDRGARIIRFHSTKVDHNALSEVTYWQNKGLDVEIASEDLKNNDAVVGLIKNYAKVGHIEGLYVIDLNDNIKEEIVEYLDDASRKYCPVLKYFAVISEKNGLGYKTCTSRAQKRLPASKLVLPSVSETSKFCNSHLDAIEQALNSAETVMMAETYEDTGLSLMDQISCITNMETPTDDNITLEALGFDGVNLTVVSKLMRETYGLCYNDEKLKSFTIKRLKHLVSMVTESEFQEVKGLGNFFAIVDSDELLSTTEMVIMPTMCNSSSIEGEFDLTHTFLCIVPGLEGHHKRFTGLCERVKSSAVVLQPGLDNLEETIPEMAQNYAQVFLKKTGLKSDFYLMGYESGVLVALEMAALLEANGCTGTVFCVGTPEDFNTTLEEELKVYKTEEDLQDAVAEHMFVLMSGDTKQLVDLKNIHTWDDKVNICVRTLVGRVSISAQYARTLIKAAYARLSQARRYQPRAHTLRSQIVQILAHKQKGSLQIYSEQPVIVYELKAPMSNAAADLRCSNIINKHLDRKLIEEFDDKNTCYSYISKCEHYTY